MKMFGTRKKNVKYSNKNNENTSVEITLRPGREHLILIC